MAVHVINEARRCLQCKKPMCRLKGCPAQTNIPEMIRLFLAGEINEAGAMLFENNPMSIFCSLVCDHDKQCEGNCIQGRKGSPIQISSIEHYISDAYLDKAVLPREPDKNQRVAVIGAGPAGLTVALKLAQKGYHITILERMDKIGGMLRYGIPEFRLPKKTLDRYQKKLTELGIMIRSNTTLGGALHLDDLFTDGYDAVFIGSGAWRPRRLGVKGESLGNVHFAVDYLQNPNVCNLGNRVAVIGGGNTAMDAARTAIRTGSEHVTIYVRRTQVSASIRELDYALADGVDVVYGMAIKELTEKGPVCIPRTFDDEGNVIGEGEPVLCEADNILIAASQQAKDKIVRTTTGVHVTDRGLMEVDDDGRTTREGVFSGGDVVLGPRTVVLAVKNAKHVAEAMAQYLEKKAAEKQNNPE